jgi:hypothetical protein
VTRTWEDLEQGANRDYGEAWLPDRDDAQPRTLVGMIAGYDRGPVSTFTGEQPWICAVRDRDGKDWSVWLNRTVLVSEWERHRPMPGERIAVRYRGVQEEASRVGGAPAHLYRLTVDRDQELPGFLTRPQELEPADLSDIPSDLPPTDADVVDATADELGDDDLPF